MMMTLQYLLHKGSDQLKLMKAQQQTQILNMQINFQYKDKIMSSKLRKPHKELHFNLKLNCSQYTKLYRAYMQKQYPIVETLLKKIVQMPHCRQYYLKYPLDGLLKGVCKKMLINVFQLIVFGYFLSQVDWKLDPYIYATISDVFPNVFHVNQPADPDRLKQISIFLYFSSYSIKEFLNQDIAMYRQQMLKIIPQFQYIQNTWTTSQHTVGQILSPRLLNKFYQQAMDVKIFPNYNFCVDKIIQISPCYDLASKNQKEKEIVNFGFMDMDMDRRNQGIGQFPVHDNNVTDLYFHNNNNQNQNQIKIEGIDMSDFKQFQGDL